MTPHVCLSINTTAHFTAVRICDKMSEFRTSPSMDGLRVKQLYFWTCVIPTSENIYRSLNSRNDSDSKQSNNQALSACCMWSQLLLLPYWLLEQQHLLNTLIDQLQTRETWPCILQRNTCCKNHFTMLRSGKDIISGAWLPRWLNFVVASNTFSIIFAVLSSAYKNASTYVHQAQGNK